MSATKTPTFADEMERRLNDIEARAKALGSNMTRLCKKTGIARATYERWRYRAPQSITKVDDLAAEVERLEKLSPSKLAEELSLSTEAQEERKPGRRTHRIR